jgi:hypothetical protein
MNENKQQIVLSIALIVINFTFLTPPVAARPDRHHKDKHNRVYENSTQAITVTTNNFTLTYEQQSLLLNLLRNKNSNNYLLSDRDRLQITNQINSLPPGIRKRLAKGKKLPSGIARQIVLSDRVNSYLNLPSNKNIVIIGNTVAVVDPVTSIILAVIDKIF